MADFSDKKIRTFYENVLESASLEDIALLLALLKPAFKRALARVHELSNKEILALDPVQDKPKIDKSAAAPAKSDE